MPKKINGKPVDESKWNKAKEIAAKEGHADNYKYIMGIYKQMEGMKSMFILGDLLKGRKAEADGTIKEVKGTKYHRIKIGGKWQHVKIQKNGQVVDSTGNVIATVNASGKADLTVSAPTKKIGRGRPKGSTKTPTPVASPADPVKRGRGRPKGSTNKNKLVVSKPDPAPAPPVVQDVPKKRGRPRKDATTVQDVKVKEKKAPAAKKERDEYPIGARVLRKNANGTMYWSVKGADGKWSYDGVASAAEVKAWKLNVRRKKQIEREKKVHEERVNKIKIKDADNSDEWNPDGTPKQSLLDTMSTKEKMYWTQATANARELCKKTGILCLDKNSEDYVEERLNSVFQLSAEQEELMEKIKADVPLDTDAKFADDPVFMLNTLEKLKELKNQLVDNPDEARARLMERITVQFNWKNKYGNRVGSELFHRIDEERTKLERVAAEYDELVSATNKWIKAIENIDSDRITLAKAREEDKELIAFANNAGALPEMAMDAVFGEDLELASERPEDVNSGIFKFIADELGVPIDRILLKEYPRQAGTKQTNRSLKRILVQLLHKDFESKFPIIKTKDDMRYDRISSDLFNQKAVIDQSYYYQMQKYSPSDPEYIPESKIIELSKKIKEKYPALSEFISNSIDIPMKASAPYYTTIADDRESILKYSGTLKDYIKSYASIVSKTNNDKAKNVIPVLKPILDKHGSDRMMDVGGKLLGQLRETYSKLSPELGSTISLNVNHVVGMKSYFDNQVANQFIPMIPYLEDRIDSSSKTKRRGLRAKNYIAGESEKSQLSYSEWKRDNTYGGGKIRTGIKEIGDDNTAMKAAIRAMWMKQLASLPTDTSGNWASDTTFSNSHTNLALAIGLNWQLRKLSKKEKIIPEWNWYGNLNPLDAKNSIQIYTDNPAISGFTITRRKKYGPTKKYKRYDTNVDSMLTEDSYKAMVVAAKNEVLLKEYGLSDSVTDSKRVKPKIVLRTNQEGADAWQKRIEDDWTHNAGNYSKGDFKVKNVFDVMYHDYYKDYKEKETELGNVQVVYHGTSFENAAKIIKDGFQTGHAYTTGNMLGSGTAGNRTEGTYVAKSSSKSAQYVAGRWGRNGAGVLFTCRAAFGKMNSGDDWTHAKRDPSYDTIYGKAGGSGGLAADEWMVRNKKKGVSRNDAIIPLQWIDVGPA